MYSMLWCFHAGLLSSCRSRIGNSRIEAIKWNINSITLLGLLRKGIWHSMSGGCFYKGFILQPAFRNHRSFGSVFRLKKKVFVGVLSQSSCRKILHLPFTIENGNIKSQAREISPIFLGEEIICFSPWRIHRRVEECFVLPRATTTLKICSPWQEKRWIYRRQVRSNKNGSLGSANMELCDENGARSQGNSHGEYSHCRRSKHKKSCVRKRLVTANLARKNHDIGKKSMLKKHVMTILIRRKAKFKKWNWKSALKLCK